MTGGNVEFGMPGGGFPAWRALMSNPSMLDFKVAASSFICLSCSFMFRSCFSSSWRMLRLRADSLVSVDRLVLDDTLDTADPVELSSDWSLIFLGVSCFSVSWDSCFLLVADPVSIVEIVSSSILSLVIRTG